MLILFNLDYIVIDVPYIGYLAIVDGGQILLRLRVVYLPWQVVGGRPWLFRLDPLQVLADLDLTPAVIYVHVGVAEGIATGLIVACFLRYIRFRVLNVLAPLNQKRLEVNAVPLQVLREMMLDQRFLHIWNF